MQIIQVDNVEFQIQDEVPFHSKVELIGLYWTYHPRFQFLKALPFKAKLLDVGAGSGGLIHWKEWGTPKRNDLMLFAVDIKQGEMFDQFEDYQVCDLDKDTLKFEKNLFDGVMMSHVFEHLKEPERVVRELHRVLKTGGQIYVEIPTPETRSYPSRSVFLEKGLDVVINNFFDDSTHEKTYDRESLEKIFKDGGFKVVTAGVIENKFLEDPLLSYGFHYGHSGCVTFAVWSKLRWAHYAIFEKLGGEG